MLDKETKTRVKYSKTCIGCDGRELQPGDIIRGYQYEKNKYVIIEDEEIERIKTKRDRAITIERFVDAASIDPLYFDKAYHLRPEGADKAYALLASALEAEGKAGIARTAAWGARQTLACLRANDGGLVLNTMHFADEIRARPIDVAGLPKPDGKELELARGLVVNMTGEFDVVEFKDEYREKLLDAIENKIRGQEVIAAANEPLRSPEVLNLMDALKASIAAQGASAPS